MSLYFACVNPYLSVGRLITASVESLLGSQANLKWGWRSE
ncbi:GDP-D-mannose dehydratase [Pseudomonas syringae pv. actinidiae]|uniref:GDP-D-mannose dehydratase n=1 Tax=Pseudomonas syringae pv. actinidiae TaxID=103796 RepID=A0AAN4QCY9_PSESF|nr:GDP-D-mannose dehydratase [Pseudomonas syringae pv. actinidiae]